MKKLFLVLCSALALCLVSCNDNPEPNPGPTTGQDTVDTEDVISAFIYDGSFEKKWKELTAERGKYWEYQTALFNTLNLLYELPIDPLPCEVTAFRSTDAQDGKYSIKLVTANLNGMLLVPGAFGTISPDFVGEFLNDGGITVKKEFPYKPASLTGYYKYSPVEGDSAAIDMELFSNNKVIASKVLKIKNATDEWTAFTIPFEYTDDNAKPTHLKLLFISSAGYNFDDLQTCKGQANSTLYIDNVQFTY